MDKEQLVVAVNAEKVRLIRFLYCDNGGVIRGKLVHTDDLAEVQILRWNASRKNKSITSTNGILLGVLKKCIPINISGRLRVVDILFIDNEDVLLAKTVVSEIFCSNSASNFVLTS